jgi:protein Mpv17
VAYDEKQGNSASMSWDLARTGRIGLFGLLFYGPASGYWYGFLDSYVLPDQPTSAVAVAIKTGADQLIWAPVLITALFSWDLAWSEEQDISNLPNKLRQDLLSTLLVNWTFWPAFHLVNFRFVSPIDRVLYINVVQVFFNVFLCWQAAKQLGEEADEGASD